LRSLAGSSRRETGHELPDSPLIALGEIRQKSGKLVLAWAARGDLDAATAVSNTYQMEWPPRSGRVETFPEIDRVEWFKLSEARRKLKAAQVPFRHRPSPRQPGAGVPGRSLHRLGSAKEEDSRRRSLSGSGSRPRWSTRGPRSGSGRSSLRSPSGAPNVRPPPGSLNTRHDRQGEQRPACGRVWGGR
jgi:hypothetical protein